MLPGQWRWLHIKRWIFCNQLKLLKAIMALRGSYQRKCSINATYVNSTAVCAPRPRCLDCSIIMPQHPDSEAKNSSLGDWLGACLKACLCRDELSLSRWPTRSPGAMRVWVSHPQARCPSSRSSRVSSRWILQTHWTRFIRSQGESCPQCRTPRGGWWWSFKGILNVRVWRHPNVQNPFQKQTITFKSDCLFVS